MSMRFERKYLVPNELLFPLRRRLHNFLSPDPFAERRGDIAQYTVRSIYFDTMSLDAFWDKIEGVDPKTKLRVRAYGDEPRENDVFLEIKERIGDTIAKQRARTPLSDLVRTLESGDLAHVRAESSLHQNSGSRFFYLLKRCGQRPANLIVYEREPFISKFDQGVRVTLDKNVRTLLFPRVQDLFERRRLSFVWDDVFVLEIKHDRPDMPAWARRTIEQFGLQRESLSKYATAFLGRDRLPFGIRVSR